MKRLILMTLMSLGAFAFAGSASAGIATTAHDLSANGSQICVYCHTPHNANTSVAAPLWNRQSSAASYTMYTSATIVMTIAGTPQGVSLACLSCHDGTLAYNALINPGDATNSGTMSGDHKIGPDLSNDHPISVTYNAALDSAGFVTATDGKVGGLLPLYGTGKDQVECATCHSVHDNSNGYFQRKSNSGSDLCLTCHIK